MKAKLMHLPDTIVLTITVEAAKKGTNFKNYCEQLIIKDAEKIEKR